MMGKVSESIYSGSVVVPLADVQHMEMHPKNSVPGMHVITKHTKWNHEHDVWENSIWLNEPEATTFRRVWCYYRAELEAETLADLTAPSIWMREADAGTDNACWVPCAKGDPGASPFDLKEDH